MNINQINTNYINYCPCLNQTNKTNTSNKADSRNVQNQLSDCDLKPLTDISFNGFFSDLFCKKFSTKEEKTMYKDINSSLSGKDKANFDILYKTGRLTNRTSNDKSSTLENLYKIYKNPRIKGLDNKKILSETIERLANPFIINQTFGRIPNDIANNVLNNYSKTNSNECVPKTQNDLTVTNSSCCVAASIEFSLADKKPAEFARFVAELSGEKMEVTKKIKFSNLNKNLLDALFLLNLFNVETTNADWNEFTMKIAPDRDAIVRARVQNTQYNGKNRSSVDVLLQSAFMQLGSQKTYNSLTDKRYGKLNPNDTGLTEMEKTFVESIVNNDGEKTSVVYQNIDDNGIVQNYFYKFDDIQKHITDTLAQNKNVIIGIVPLDKNNKIIGSQGHEITITGSKIKNNELYFICNDTDDDYVGSREVSAKTLLPQIHHAGIPIDVIANYKDENKGLELLREYSQKYISGQV